MAVVVCRCCRDCWRRTSECQRRSCYLGTELFHQCLPVFFRGAVVVASPPPPLEAQAWRGKRKSCGSGPGRVTGNPPLLWKSLPQKNAEMAVWHEVEGLSGHSHRIKHVRVGLVGQGSRGTNIVHCGLVRSHLRPTFSEHTSAVAAASLMHTYPVPTRSWHHFW